MKVNITNMKNVFVFKNNTFYDERGFLKRVICKKDLKKIFNINFDIKQTNYSFNLKKYTLRGFHYQKKPFEEDKVITCINGKVYDIVLDLRPKSKSFLNWTSLILDSNRNESLFIPKGCANAWITLQNNTSLIYHHSQFYKPKHELSIRYNDPKFEFQWPKKPHIISSKDKNIANFKLENL